MPAPSPDAPLARAPRARALRHVLPALVGFALTAVFAVPASGQSASDKLADVRAKQERIAAQIQSHNGEVNALIARVSEARRREEKVNAELAEREQELATASVELAAGRERLAELRKEAAVASNELEEMLVAIYKDGSPDLFATLLGAADFEQFAAQSEYLERVQAYQASVLERARDLREESEAIVAKLAADKERISEARDAIAARRDELAGVRAALEQEEAELAAARKARRQILAKLDRRENHLIDVLSTPTSSDPSTPQPAAPPKLVPGERAQLGPDGKASAPEGAPPAVKAAIAAANQIADHPYVWGGGHGSFEDSGYDCSGAVSYALHGAGLISSPSDSTGLMFWGDAGPGKWITVYAHSGHTYVVIAGLRFDTSGGAGPRWHADARSSAGFVARHPPGL